MPSKRNLLRLVLLFCFLGDASATISGAKILRDKVNFPLRTEGRFIVDTRNERVKWACVNWHGLEQATGVPGGLDEKKFSDIALRIKELGFNCVRVPISVYGVLRDPHVDDSRVNASLNPDMAGLRWREMFDKTIDALSSAQLMIILDRHMLMPGNNPSNVSLQAGLWYGLGFSPEDNIRALEILAERTKDKHYVVAFDVINEPHDYGGVKLTWGDGDKLTDLHRYFETAGNAVLAKNPNLLIIAEGMCCGKILDYLKAGPQIRLITGGRIVHSPHSYVFFMITGVISTNAGGLRGLDNMSWPWIAWWCTCIDVVIILPFTAVLWFFWYVHGMPRIELRIWFRALTGWLALACFALAITYYVMFYNMKYGVGYCSYEADTRHWPNVVGYTLAFIVLAGSSVGTHYGPGCKKTEQRELLQELVSEEMKDLSHDGSLSESSESSTQVEDARTHQCVLGCSFAQCTHFNENLFANLVAASTCLFLACFGIGTTASYFSTQTYFDDVSDSNFGFLIQEHMPYTAPVFVGEFGTSQDSEFFQMMISYLASRDLDWAYWPLNPVRPFGGVIGPGGFEEGNKDPDEWVEDTWSFVGRDWDKVRHPWMLQRITRVMRWPSLQTGYVIPCNRLVTPECGG